jgi:hypothetical protein
MAGHRRFTTVGLSHASHDPQRGFYTTYYGFFQFVFTAFGNDGAANPSPLEVVKFW